MVVFGNASDARLSQEAANAGEAITLARISRELRMFPPGDPKQTGDQYTPPEDCNMMFRGGLSMKFNPVWLAGAILFVQVSGKAQDFDGKKVAAALTLKNIPSAP